MNLYLVNTEYNEFLFHFEQKIAITTGTKKKRPFLGELIQIEDFIYVAPLSSPKSKHEKMHNTEDFIKIEDGRLGVINLNNMIPVSKKNITKIEIKKVENQPYANLLKKQLQWCKKHEQEIIEKAIQLYNEEAIAKSSVYRRCCDFQLIERKCIQYKEQYLIQEEGEIYLCA